jgi:hypothetical protein
MFVLLHVCMVPSLIVAHVFFSLIRAPCYHVWLSLHVQFGTSSAKSSSSIFVFALFKRSVCVLYCSPPQYSLSLCLSDIHYVVRDIYMQQPSTLVSASSYDLLGQMRNLNPPGGSSGPAVNTSMGEPVNTSTPVDNSTSGDASAGGRRRLSALLPVDPLLSNQWYLLDTEVYSTKAQNAWPITAGEHQQPSARHIMQGTNQMPLLRQSKNRQNFCHQQSMHGPTCPRPKLLTESVIPR